MNIDNKIENTFIKIENILNKIAIKLELIYEKNSLHIHSDKTTLKELGFDNSSYIDIKKELEKSFHINIDIKNINKCYTYGDLGNLILDILELNPNKLYNNENFLVVSHDSTFEWNLHEVEWNGSLNENSFLKIVKVNDFFAAQDYNNEIMYISTSMKDVISKYNKSHLKVFEINTSIDIFNGYTYAKNGYNDEENYIKKEFHQTLIEFKKILPIFTYKLKILNKLIDMKSTKLLESLTTEKKLKNFTSKIKELKSNYTKNNIHTFLYILEEELKSFFYKDKEIKSFIENNIVENHIYDINVSLDNIISFEEQSDLPF